MPEANVNEQEIEQALRRALRPVHPEEDFSERVVMRLGSTAPSRMAGWRRMSIRWTSVALAACAIAGVALVSWKQESVERQRGLEARAQLLRALSIASAKVNVARAAVIREEEPVE
jgi:hypothetical protein